MIAVDATLRRRRGSFSRSRLAKKRRSALKESARIDKRAITHLVRELVGVTLVDRLGGEEESGTVLGSHLRRVRWSRRGGAGQSPDDAMAGSWKKLLFSRQTRKTRSRAPARRRRATARDAGRFRVDGASVRRRRSGRTLRRCELEGEVVRKMWPRRGETAGSRRHRSRQKLLSRVCVSSGPEKTPAARASCAPGFRSRRASSGTDYEYSFERRESLKVDDASFKNVVDRKTNYSRPARFIFRPRKGQAEGGEEVKKAEVKKAEAAAKARTGRSSRWRPRSGTARALRAARRPGALVVVREPRLHLRTDSREATSPNSEEKREKVSRPAGFEPTRALPKRYRVFICIFCV